MILPEEFQNLVMGVDSGTPAEHGGRDTSNIGPRPVALLLGCMRSRAYVGLRSRGAGAMPARTGATRASPTSPLFDQALANGKLREQRDRLEPELPHQI